MSNQTLRAELERRLAEIDGALKEFEDKRGIDTPVDMAEEWGRSYRALQEQKATIESRLASLDKG